MHSDTTGVLLSARQRLLFMERLEYRRVSEPCSRGCRFMSDTKWALLLRRELLDRGRRRRRSAPGSRS